MADLYDIVADKTVEFCEKTYPYDCFVKFEMSYDGKEWEQVHCVVECDVDYNIVFQWDFCEGQTHIRNFRICHTDEAEIIVRCKDCKYLKVYYHEVNRYSYECSRWEKLNIQPFDYCSRAEYKEERKEEVEE